MLTLLLLAPPLGVVAGYLATSLLIANLSWQWVFYLQACIAVVPTAMLLCLTKNKYFDIEAAVERRFEEE